MFEFVFYFFFVLISCLFLFFIVSVKNRCYNNTIHSVFILKNMLSFAILIFFHRHKHAHTRTHVCACSFLILFLIFCRLFSGMLTRPVALLYKRIPAFCVTSNKISNFEQMALYRFASFLLYVYVCPSHCPPLWLSLSCALCLSFSFALCACVCVRVGQPEQTTDC